jgi:soluble cytochrome b562
MLLVCAMGQEEFQELSSFLKRFIRRLKLLQGAEGLCLTAICALLLFALGPGIDRLKHFFPYAPLAYSLLTALVLLAAVVWSVFRFLRRFSQERAALYIEQKEPKLRNNLINSLQLYPQVVEGGNAPGFSTSMVLALLRATRRQIAALKVDDLIDTGKLKSSLRLLVFLFVPVAAMVLFNPSWVGGTIDMLTRPLDHLPPSKTEIEIEPKGLRVVRGSPVTIQARTSGAIPGSLEIVTWTALNERGETLGEEKAGMENLGAGRFSARIPRLEKTLRYRAVTGQFSSPVYIAEAVDPPEIANVQLVLYPPAYTGLTSVTAPEGSIEGLKGSSLRLDAAVTKEVVKAEIVMDDGKKIPLKIDGRKLQANFVLFQSQSYRIAVEDAHGFRNSPITYSLNVKPDGFPTVDLLRPTEDLEISGDEILTLEYSARDDFGIGEIALVTKIGDREDKIVLQKDEAKRLVLREQFKWDLGRLGLREGEEAIFVLQVFDNDTISGPKIGTSRSVRLKLKDLKGEHQQIAEMVRDLNQRMVDLLGDHLETPLPNEKSAVPAKEMEQRFEQNLAEAVKRTEEIMRRTEKDRMSDFATWSDLDALKRNLEFTRNELLAKQAQAASDEDKMKSRDEISSELERMSLLSEDISKRMKAQQVASAAQDLARSQERLMDALDKLQAGDKNLDAIMKQIADLAKTLASLQQSLSQMARLPDDFMNAENMQGLGFDDMMRALDEIRKKLMAGDIEGARQLARELFNQMAQMVAALQNAQRSAMNSGMGRMQGEMQRQTSELQEIARAQQEILVQTEGVNNAAMSERDAALKKKLDEFLAKAIAELGKLTELFPDREGPDDPSLLTHLDDATMNALLRNLIAKLNGKDFSGFHEGDGLARKELAKKRTAAQEPRAQRAETSLDAIKSELDALMKEPARGLTDAEKRELRDLAHRQDILKERTQNLHEKLEALFQLFPQLDPKIVQNIGEAGAAMGSAQGRLGQLDAPGAVPPERTALERLSQSQQQMQSAMQQMAQRGQLGNMPMTRLFRQGRFLPYGSLTPLPGMPQFPEFDIESGFTGLDTEKFRLPGKDEYKAPRNFREEILESLKQGVPPQMKEQIERYFKNLSE